jgi:hypothetical protein
MNYGPKRAAVAGAVLLAASALIIACYPGDELTVSETDAVITVFNQSADFSTKLTYAMPDTVIHLVEEGDDDDITRAHDASILSGIRAGLEGLGFTESLDPATADVHVLTGVTVNDYVGYYWYGGYWCYWYGYPPAWGWYPYYPGGGYSYSYSVGTILIMMFDRDDADATEPTAPIWSAALNGLANQSSGGQRISNGIDQAFAQSQYLGAGK